jgi:hypothetical protein
MASGFEGISVIWAALLAQSNCTSSTYRYRMSAVQIPFIEMDSKHLTSINSHWILTTILWVLSLPIFHI